MKKNTRNLFITTLLAGLFSATNAQAACDDSTWLGSACKRLSDTWTEGDSDLYVPFRAYHMRFAYDHNRIKELREDTWGLGYGRSRYSNGGWDGIYGMAFLDSHSNWQPIIGYSHQWVWGQPQAVHARLGYTALVTIRQDVWKGLPLPGLLPVAAVGYDKYDLNMAYVPGGQGNGNVAFLWATLKF